MAQSSALTTWRTTRAANLDALREAHRTVGGSGSGRRWNTEQLNYAMILTLCAEWQGYCRDLHDEAFRAIVDLALLPGSPYLDLIVGAATSGRQLDKANPDVRTIGTDFAIFNRRTTFWERAKILDPATPSLMKRLTDLVDGRNGIAHRDASKIAEVNARGYKLHTLGTLRIFRTAMDQLASIVDTVVADQVAETCGGHQPW